MNPLFLIPIFLVISYVVFMFFMNKKHKNLKSSINLESERTKYDQYKLELLNQEFSKVKKWMKGKPIDAFTSASVPQSTSDKIQQLVTDGVKNVALSVIGVKLKTIDTECFFGFKR